MLEHTIITCPICNSFYVYRLGIMAIDEYKCMQCKHEWKEHKEV